MHVLLEIRRSGERYEGSLTRVSDHRCLQFTGILELLAALETLEPNDSHDNHASADSTPLPGSEEEMY